MDHPFLSIIIPVYNAANYLSDTLACILQTGIRDMEILLIDDGSTDGSALICQSYVRKADLSIRLFSQINRGPSAARNLGLDECRGECVAFLDADDVIDPVLFRKAVSAMRDSGAELLATDFTRISGNGCVLDRIHQIEETDLPITDPAYLLHFLSDGEVVWNVWRYLFRRSFLLQNGLRFAEDVNCAEDLEFTIHALTACSRPIFLHAPFYAYRVHYGNTLTQRYSAKRIQDLMKMLCVSADRLKSADGEAARLLENKIAKEYLLNLAILYEMPETDRKTALTACRESFWVLDGAGKGVVKAAASFTRLVGLPCAARMLLGLKHLKRSYRKCKIKCYEMKRP